MTAAKYRRHVLYSCAVAVIGLASGRSVAAATPTLDMSDQLSLEKQELRTFAMPALQAELNATEEVYRKSDLGKLQDGSPL